MRWGPPFPPRSVPMGPLAEASLCQMEIAGRSFPPDTTELESENAATIVACIHISAASILRRTRREEPARVVYSLDEHQRLVKREDAHWSNGLCFQDTFLTEINSLKGPMSSTLHAPLGSTSGVPSYCRRALVQTQRSRRLRLHLKAAGMLVPSDRYVCPPVSEDCLPCTSMPETRHGCSRSFGGRSPEKKAADLLRTMFTFCAARYVSVLACTP